MKTIIESKGTEFEQNLKDLAIIDTADRAGKPIMIDQEDLEEALSNTSVEISGVEGHTLQDSKNVTPTTSSQDVEPDEGYDAIKKVVVAGVTSAIDANIVASNIKSGVTILGVTGTYEGSATLTLDYNGGTDNEDTSDEVVVDLGATVSLETYDGANLTPPTDKVFSGWTTTKDDDTTIVTSVTVSADTTVYALWENAPAPEESAN